MYSQVLSSLAPPALLSQPAPDSGDVQPRSSAAASVSSNAQSSISSSVTSHIGMSSSWELDLLLQHFMRVSK